ncbi:DUF3891 family protein [Piscibacillus halophilus]|uniref:DUF3891 family protein n=1 Tax=Piscibacillus halophilus TaxID=571933 RepID=UPI001589FE45|nr:DUF3891 family protein [Piscibacillus halophilus]
MGFLTYNIKNAMLKDDWMIVSAHDGRYQLFTQHNHSILSGQFVPYWEDQLFIGAEYFKDVQLAVREHDRAWIPLDQTPIWNADKKLPHSFMDYPQKPKLEAYTKGIDEVEQLSPYAGLLNSLHFLSFFKEKTTDSDISRFISREIDRQNQIREQLGIGSDEEIMDFHFKLLQFCDDLSLYICLNKPNVSKQEENFMFREGFRQCFSGLNNKITAYWVDEEVIELKPFPFKAPFKVSIPYKELTEEEVEEKGLEQAYRQSVERVRSVIISY